MASDLSTPCDIETLLIWSDPQRAAWDAHLAHLESARAAIAAGDTAIRRHGRAHLDAEIARARARIARADQAQPEIERLRVAASIALEAQLEHAQPIPEGLTVEGEVDYEIRRSAKAAVLMRRANGARYDLQAALAASALHGTPSTAATVLADRETRSLAASAYAHDPRGYEIGGPYTCVSVEEARAQGCSASDEVVAWYAVSEADYEGDNAASKYLFDVRYYFAARKLGLEPIELPPPAEAAE